LSRIKYEAFRRSGLIEIIVRSSVELVGAKCFECISLSSIKFESGSRLSRIEEWAFCRSGLIEIVIPSSVEFLGDECFGRCEKLQSIEFERNSRLQFVGRDVFLAVPVRPVFPEMKGE
jgi:hypothetical protein